MQRAVPSKNSRSFLEKFEGKKNAISREGLLHLLDVKKQSFDDVPQKEKQKVILLREPKLDPLAHPKESRGDRARSNGKDPTVGHPAFVVNDLQERYARMREELHEPKSVELGNGSKVRLPAINKSSSHSTHLHKKNAETAPAEHSEESAAQRMRSMPRKLEAGSGSGNGSGNGESLILNNLGKKIQLDKYALRHLEFLDKFQKQLLQNDLVAKKTSRSEYH